MRLLHLLAETGFSGGEGQLKLILEHFQRRGHEQSVVLAPGAAFAATARELGVPFAQVPMRRWWRPDLWPRLRRLVRRADADILHFACSRSLLVGGVAALGRTARVKLTIRRIDYPIRRGLLGGFRYNRLVDHTVAICTAIRQRLRDAGVGDDRTSLVYDGIDPAPWLGLQEQRVAARQALGIPAEALLISCVGILRPRKGQAVLLEAFAGLAARYPQANLFLAGGGDSRDALLRQAQALGLGARVRVPGPVRPVQNVYAASDIFCMPSFHEGLCNACLEASFAALPQVVSDAGGNAEIVADGMTGAVVPAGDAPALAAALDRYLADPALRRRHGEAGRARSLQHFTADRLGPDLERLCQRLLEAKRV
jgi:glycosyltransferase involved in cell wall biosynthesis